MAKATLIGKRFGRLKVLGEGCQKDFGSYKKRVVPCQCDCGSDVEVLIASLLSGKTASCGCLMREVNATLHFKHGMKGTKEYRAWKAMIQRATNTGLPCAKNYSKRGIGVHPDWLGEGGFQRFLNELGRAPTPGHTLDRVKNEIGYQPGNCRWATRSEQSRNTRSNLMVEYKGIELTVTDAASALGLSRSTLISRIKAGKTGDDLFENRDQRRNG